MFSLLVPMQGKYDAVLVAVLAVLAATVGFRVVYKGWESQKSKVCPHFPAVTQSRGGACRPPVPRAMHPLVRDFSPYRLVKWCSRSLNWAKKLVGASSWASWVTCTM